MIGGVGEGGQLESTCTSDLSTRPLGSGPRSVREEIWRFCGACCEILGSGPPSQLSTEESDPQGAQWLLISPPMSPGWCYHFPHTSSLPLGEEQLFWGIQGKTGTDHFCFLAPTHTQELRPQPEQERLGPYLPSQEELCPACEALDCKCCDCTQSVAILVSCTLQESSALQMLCIVSWLEWLGMCEGQGEGWKWEHWGSLAGHVCIRVTHAVQPHGTDHSWGLSQRLNSSHLLYLSTSWFLLGWVLGSNDTSGTGYLIFCLPLEVS